MLIGLKTVHLIASLTCWTVVLILVRHVGKASNRNRPCCTINRLVVVNLCPHHAPPMSVALRVIRRMFHLLQTLWMMQNSAVKLKMFVHFAQERSALRLLSSDILRQAIQMRGRQTLEVFMEKEKVLVKKQRKEQMASPTSFLVAALAKWCLGALLSCMFTEKRNTAERQR